MLLNLTIDTETSFIVHYDFRNNSSSTDCTKLYQDCTDEELCTKVLEYTGIVLDEDDLEYYDSSSLEDVLECLEDTYNIIVVAIDLDGLEVED